MMIKMANTKRTRKDSREPESLKAGTRAQPRRERGRGGRAREASDERAQRGERTLRIREESRRKERPKPKARQAQAPRASPENRVFPVTTTTKMRCSRGQPCPHCGQLVQSVQFQTGPHDEGYGLNTRRPKRFRALRAVRHVQDCTFTVSFMEQRPSSPLSYLQVAKSCVNPRAQAASSSLPQRSVPTSGHSRGAFQPPNNLGRRGTARNSRGRPQTHHGSSPPPASHRIAIKQGQGGPLRAVAVRAAACPVLPPGRRAAVSSSFDIGVDRHPPVGKRHRVVKKDHGLHPHRIPTINGRGKNANPYEMEQEQAPQPQWNGVSIDLFDSPL